MGLQRETYRIGLDAGVAPGYPLFVCPCHFSVFDPLSEGATLGGPAFRGLYRFKLQVWQETVEITQVEEEVLTLLDPVGAAAPAPTHPDSVSLSQEER